MNDESREEGAPLEDLGLDVMGFEAIIVVCAVAERLVAGTSASIILFHHLSIDND